MMGQPRLFARLICLAASGAMLCACASNRTVSETDEDEARVPSDKQACFRPGQVSGFRSLDRSNLIVYASTRSRAYHVRITPAARELDFANTIAFDTSATRICGYAGEAVLFESGGMARKYFVTEVYALDTEATQNLILQFSEDLTIEPQNTSGAVIERDIEDDEG
jgi:hypothetical protein